jgi:trafficking protein particle complex subunit 2
MFHDWREYVHVLENSLRTPLILFIDIKFLLLHAPAAPTTTLRNPATATSPQTEEAIRQFFVEVYESWVKTIMSHFYQVNMEVKSPIFRGKVIAAAKKYL